MPITWDQELWACALHMEQQHGEGAFLHASLRIDALDAEGDRAGADTWRAILERIEALLDGSAARN